MAQIFTNTYQKSLDCNALQLLYHTSPIIAVVRILLPSFLCCLLICYSFVCVSGVFYCVLCPQGMLFMCPFFDDLTALVNYQYTVPCIIRIGTLSCTDYDICRVPMHPTISVTYGVLRVCSGFMFVCAGSEHI